MENHFYLNAGVHFDQPDIPTWHSLTAMDSDLQFPPPPLTDCFFDSSAISSMASSPVSNSNESFLIKELIGKLGNICNSGGETINRAIHPVPPAIPGDPKFIERAARFSSLGSQSFNGRNTHLPCTNAASSKLHRVCSSPSINASEVRNPRKRKSLPKGKCRDVPCSSPPKELNEKRSKLNPEINDRKTEHRLEEEEDDEEEDEDEIKKQSIKQKQSIDAPKDYIHVRARRGQATDSHSLAERVRREKISERMKLLQDLVPGCNKVTGKALMLEEIINYVQSLQGQVEFLSMKLASVHPRLDFNHPQQNAFGAKNNYPSDYENQLQQNGMGLHCSNSMDPIINQSHDLHLPTLDGFNNGVHELCEGDLHSIVQMGFAQNTQSLHGSNQAAAMKTEF